MSICRWIAFGAQLGCTFVLPPAALAQHSESWPDSAWRAIGPAKFGGRVDDIEAVPSDPRIIYVGTASGGVFKSVNNGTTWAPIFDSNTALSIGDIALAPSNPNIVWVGTGEANNRQSSTWGDGVYCSTDGGATWQHMGLRETQSIGRIVIDPHDPNIVFVAAVGHLFGPNEERGLYRTKNGGKNWERVLGVDPNTGVTDVVMAPDGRTLVAATYMRRRRAWGFVGGGPTSGLWRSTDGGDHWQRLTSGLPSGDVGRIGIDIARSDPNIMYALIEAKEGGVFRSSDRGATWTRQSPLQERPNYFSQIRIDTKDPERVWWLATSLYHSIDGGKTFKSDSTAIRVHPDHHAMWIDPSDSRHIMLANDGGVYFTYDEGRNWDYVDNLPIGQFYDVAVDAREPYWIYGGTQDNGTFAFPSGTYSRGALTDAQVMHIGYGDGFEVATDPANPRVVYTNSQNGRGYVFDLDTREERRITPVPAERTERYRFNWNTAILVSPNDPHTYYYGANKLLRTTDYGTTWQAISPDLTRAQDWRKLPLGPGMPLRDRATLSRDDGTSEYGNITTISESPKAAGTIYVGTDDGNVQVTTDGGARWTNLTSRFGLTAPHSVSAVLASRFDARTAYVAFDGHTDDDLRPYLFRTTDGGATWTSIASDLPPNGPVKTITEDPRNPRLLFAGTEFGLYWSLDGGRHWLFPGGALPHVMVDRVVVNERTNDLVIGTHGRSVIILDDVAPLETWDPSPSADPVQLFPLRDATEVYQWRDQPLPGARTFTAPNVPLGTFVTYWLGKDGDAAAPVQIRILGADGKVVRELTGPSTRGMHRIEWDLRMQFAFVPPASDSGFYGPPRPPFVQPGDYAVQLIGGAKTLSRTVHVRSDPREVTTPDAVRARWAMMMQVDSLSRAFAPEREAFVAADSEYTRLIKQLGGPTSSVVTSDSVVKSVTSAVTTLRGRLSAGYSAPIGQAFDLLGGLESSSAAPTEAERRTLDAAIADLRDAFAKLHELETTEMPRLRQVVSSHAAR
ncbi:MAG TPA: hypothetical protein VGH98_10250 [Gemmatimonadaceae bacterium]|jgi:photosystem II stability/assembly factor-like uncharacterized protein